MRGAAPARESPAEGPAEGKPLASRGNNNNNIIIIIIIIVIRRRRRRRKKQTNNSNNSNNNTSNNNTNVVNNHMYIYIYIYIYSIIRYRGRDRHGRHRRGPPARERPSRGGRRGGERGGRRDRVPHFLAPGRQLARLQGDDILLVAQQLGGLDLHEVVWTEDLDRVLPHRLVRLAAAVVHRILVLGRVPGAELPGSLELNCFNISFVSASKSLSKIGY